MTQWYNQLHSTILAVELGLVKGEMDQTRHQLDPALRELTWAQDDLWDYIQSTRDLVKVCEHFQESFDCIVNKQSVLLTYGVSFQYSS